MLVVRECVLFSSCTIPFYILTLHAFPLPQWASNIPPPTRFPMSILFAKDQRGPNFYFPSHSLQTSRFFCLLTFKESYCCNLKMRARKEKTKIFRQEGRFEEGGKAAKILEKEKQNEDSEE